MVARLAGPRSFGRGRAYADEGAVGRLEVGDNRLSAVVQGTQAYRVELVSAAAGIESRCTCPIGVEGAFCKHCVAVSLCWLEDRTPQAPALDGEVRDYLLTLDGGELASLLIEAARDDPRMAERLRARLVTSTDAPDGAALAGLIARAFAVHGFVHYREMWDYVGGIGEAVDALETFLERGDAGEAIPLIERALVDAERALDHVDDSDGQMGAVIERLEELHLVACRRATPDPVGLAERLFTWEHEGDWDTFDRAVLRYSEVLGADGLAHYRTLATERWNSTPVLAPGDERRESFGDRFQITRIMEALAELTGDLDQMVAVRERDLSSPYCFLRLAELCAHHGDLDAALGWGERGMREFESADPRLREFLAEEYRRRGRMRDALELSWEAFVDRPGLASYQQLAADSELLGEWTAGRERAQSLLMERSRPAAEGVAGNRHWGQERDRSELVRVALWEGEVEIAWQHASEGGCGDQLWLELAARRREQHPADALAVYKHQVEAEISGKNRQAYAQAVASMGEVRAVLEEMGRAQEFAAYVGGVRESHKRKRNLVKLLDALRK